MSHYFLGTEHTFQRSDPGNLNKSFNNIFVLQIYYISITDKNYSIQESLL